MGGYQIKINAGPALTGMDTMSQAVNDYCRVYELFDGLIGQMEKRLQVLRNAIEQVREELSRQSANQTDPAAAEQMQKRLNYLKRCEETVSNLKPDLSGQQTKVRETAASARCSKLKISSKIEGSKKIIQKILKI